MSLFLTLRGSVQSEVMFLASIFKKNWPFLIKYILNCRKNNKNSLTQSYEAHDKSKNIATTTKNNNLIINFKKATPILGVLTTTVVQINAKYQRNPCYININ